MAQVTVIPNPVGQGEQFKVEGSGFSVKVEAIIDVDGEEVGQVYPNPSPEGGAVAFWWAIDEVGTFEVNVHQQLQGADAKEAKESGLDFKGKDDVEVVSLMPEPVAQEEPVEKEETVTVKPRTASKS